MHKKIIRRRKTVGLVLAVLALILMSFSVLPSCKKSDNQSVTTPQKTNEVTEEQKDNWLVLTEDGKFKKKVYVGDWECGDYLCLGGFRYHWQGKDSIDYRIEDGLLWVNSQLVGANLMKIKVSYISHPERILTVIIDKVNLGELQQLSALEAVEVENDSFSDTALAKLSKLTTLRGLYLWDTNITDADLVHLKKFTNLRELYLITTKITDKGLAHLEGLTNLKELYLSSHSQVSEAGVAKLQKALPDCEISVY